MAWQDRLRKASFRGVPFEIEEDSGKFGRRTETHEYPQRDKPYTEDLGRATREFNVTGFVIGPDYMDRRDALLAALEQGGPGALVHPWLGALQVSVGDVTVSHNLRDGGVCRFQIAFVEAGELSFPASSESLGAQSLLAADSLQEVAEADFAANFTVTGLPSFVAESAIGDLNALLDTVEAGLGGVAQVLSNPLDVLRAQLSLPQDMVPATIVDEVRGLYRRGSAVLEVAKELVATMGAGGVYARNHNAALALTTAANALGASTGGGAAPTTESSQQRQDNREALAVYLQRVTLVQAAGMVSTMGMPVYEDGVQVRDALTRALDDASAVASDSVYLALQQLRARVHADVTARLAGAARLVSYTPREVMSSLVIAYDRYEDVDREQEIVERNNLRHPGFVPVVPLRLLSS